MAGSVDFFIRAGADDGKPRSLTIDTDTNIKIFGVGDGGINALQNIIRSGLSGAEFIAVTSESKISHIEAVPPTQIIVIGDGKGTSGDPNVGKDAAIAARAQIAEALRGNDILVISACMGGGTGTGASHVIAKMAHDMDVLTIAVVTLPFEFEGRRRSLQASEGIESLKEYVDALLVIPNDRLLGTTDKKEPLFKLFAVTDDVLMKAVQSIIDTINASSFGSPNTAELIKTIEENTAKI